MPLYEYECRQCGRRIEKIQKFSDPALTVCPHCAGQLERTITAAAVAFKGGGWYKDLYSSAKPQAAAKNAGGESSGAAPAAEQVKGDAGAKPAAAPATPAAGAGSPSGSASSGSSSAGTAGSGSH